MDHAAISPCPRERPPRQIEHERLAQSVVTGKHIEPRAEREIQLGGRPKVL